MEIDKMETIPRSKLKPNIRMVAFAVLWILIAIMVVYLSESGFLGKKTFYLILAAVFIQAAFENLIFLIKTRNWGFAVQFLFYLDFALVNLLVVLKMKTTAIVCGILLIPLGFVLIYILVAGKISMKGRKVLELAAKPIIQTKNGFTSRPFLVGRANYTRKQMEKFARFLMRELIAISIKEKNGIVLVINSSGMASCFSFIKPYLVKTTWVSFDLSGNILVSISERDYKKYREELSFDQLCQSLGDLFKSFLEYFLRGEKEKILDMICQKNGFST
jgi:hypothetical protein